MKIEATIANGQGEWFGTYSTVERKGKLFLAFMEGTVVIEIDREKIIKQGKTYRYSDVLQMSELIVLDT